MLFFQYELIIRELFSSQIKKKNSILITSFFIYIKGKGQMSIGANNSNIKSKIIDTGTEIWSGGSGQSNNHNNNNLWTNECNNNSNEKNEVELDNSEINSSDNNWNNSSKNWSNNNNQNKWQTDSAAAAAQMHFNGNNKNKNSNTNNNWLQSQISQQRSESPSKQIVQSQQWYDQQHQQGASSNQWPNSTNQNDSSPSISNWLNPSQNDDKLGQSISSNTSVNNNNNNSNSSNPQSGSNWQPVTATTTTATTPVTVNKAPIEPVGWEEPEFKIAKKSDDGTSIWGDPESLKATKVAKWTNITRHVPNPQTIRPPLANEQDNLQQQLPQQNLSAQFPLQTQSSINSISSPLTNIPLSSSAAPATLIQSQQNQAQQQWSKPSQWTNTPAAPSLMNESTDVNVRMIFGYMLIAVHKSIRFPLCFID